jgi:hypothetical protein
VSVVVLVVVLVLRLVLVLVGGVRIDRDHDHPRPRTLDHARARVCGSAQFRHLYRVADAVSPLPCLDVSHVSRVGRSPPLARQVIFFYPLRQIGKAS